MATRDEILYVKHNKIWDSQEFVESLKDLMNANSTLANRKSAARVAQTYYEKISNAQSVAQEDIQEAKTAQATTLWAVEAQQSIVTNATAKVESFLSEDEKLQMQELGRLIIIHADAGKAPFTSTTLQYGLFVVHGRYQVEAAVSLIALRMSIMAKQGRDPLVEPQHVRP